MINLAVIELKDIVKYLVKITIMIVVAVALTKFFSSFKTKLNIDKNSFLKCLDIAIPSIKLSTQEENTASTQETKKPLKMALEVELGILDSLEKTEVASLEAESDNLETKDEEKNESNAEELKEAETGLTTEVLETNVPEKYTSEYNGVKIRNETDNIKLTEEMLTPNVDINTKNIVIFHTHSCESYTPTENFEYKASGNFRTTDVNYSVVRVGTELTKYM